MKKLLLFLSKTDHSVLFHSPQNCVNNQLALGIFVLITGTFAFISGSYAISMMFLKTDVAGNTLPLSNMEVVASCAIGFLYCCTIMMIDREIVSASGKQVILFRLILAILIGLVVSTPIELRLLETEINKQLKENLVTENNAIRLNRQKKTIDDYEASVAKLRAPFDSLARIFNGIGQQLDDEQTGKKAVGRTGKEGNGPAYRQLLKNQDEIRSQLEKAEIRWQREDGKRDSIIAVAESYFKTDSVGLAPGLMARFNALHDYIDNDKSGTAGLMHLFITLLIIVIEITPALIKLFHVKNEYEAALETRRRLNIQMTHAIGREGMEKMENNAYNAIEKPGYMTHIWQNMMKD